MSNFKFQRSPSTKRKAPSKAKMNAIREAFDPDMLVATCERDSFDFGSYAEIEHLPPHMGSDERFIYYKDNGSKILAVAHLDHVQSDVRAQVVETAAGPLVLSGALDDRLGAYVILELLPKLGMKFDILLTTDEEMGASTAEEFITEKDYHWIIEFDRGGTDVVMYDYETPALCDLVENSGAQVGVGSFSDIACLEHLGVAAFNWGVGYEDYHSAKSHAWLNDTFRMVARFWKFYEQNKDTKLVHEPKRPAWMGRGHDDDEDGFEWDTLDDLAESHFGLGVTWEMLEPEEQDYIKRTSDQSIALYEWLRERATK